MTDLFWFFFSYSVHIFQHGYQQLLKKKKPTTKGQHSEENKYKKFIPCELAAE